MLVRQLMISRIKLSWSLLAKTLVQRFYGADDILGENIVKIIKLFWAALAKGKIIKLRGYSWTPTLGFKGYCCSGMVSGLRAFCHHQPTFKILGMFLLIFQRFLFFLSTYFLDERNLNTKPVDPSKTPSHPFNEISSFLSGN